MIHVRTWVGDEIVPEDPTVQFTITSRTDLLKLQALLHRALNCAPEFGQSWFELSDKLDEFLIKHHIHR